MLHLPGPRSRDRGIRAKPAQPVPERGCLKFEVRYPLGHSHDVRSLARSRSSAAIPPLHIVVSDPVLAPPRGPGGRAEGITIRDAADPTAFRERQEGGRARWSRRLVRLGDVVVKVLPDEMPGNPHDGARGHYVQSPAAPATPAVPPSRREPRHPTAEARQPRLPRPGLRPRPRPEPRPRAAPSPGVARPLTVTLLAVLWLLSIPLYGIGGVALAHGLGWRGVWAAGPIGLGLVLTVVSGLMGYGLWSLAPWARVAQIILAAIGLFFCPFTLASAAVLVYMARPAARAAFSRTRPAAASDPAESVFAAVILGTVLLGVVASAGAVALGRRGGGSIEQARTSAREGAAVARLRTLAAAEPFRSGRASTPHIGTCPGSWTRPRRSPTTLPAACLIPPEFARARGPRVPLRADRGGRGARHGRVRGARVPAVHLRRDAAGDRRPAPVGGARRRDPRRRRPARNR